MKIISGFIIFGLLSCAVAQYGIPDDDDEPAPLRSSSSYGETLVREEPLHSSPLKFAVVSPPPAEPIRIQVANEYEQPAPVFVRAEAPQTYAQVEKVLVRNDIPSYSAPAEIRVQDSYARQPAYTSEVRKEVIPIVKYVMENDHRGTFNLETVAGDGSTHVKSGQLRNLGGEEGPVQVMSGSYSFVGDDGKTYATFWRADETGFHAVGDHLPTTPAPIH